MATTFDNPDYRTPSVDEVSAFPALITALVIVWCVYRGVVWWRRREVAREVRRFARLRATDPADPPGINGLSRKYNGRERIANLVADAAREHFGACMEHNRANVLVVQKWLRDHLRDEHVAVTNRDKITINSLAVTLFFMPTPCDVEIATIRNSQPYREVVASGVHHH